MDKNITIKDIAKMANVSAGTVDRVIHKRGNVSRDSYEKVKEVLDRIDYQPNLIAKTLKNQKNNRIAALIPDFHLDIYWEQATRGIEKALDELKVFGITVDIFAYNNLDKESFMTNAQKVFDFNPDGIIIAPLFLQASIEWIKKYRDNGILCVSFNTFIEELNPKCFIGQDLHKSGRLAAHLIHGAEKKKGRLLVFHVDEEIEYSRNMQEKEEGFKQYFSETESRTIETVRVKFDHPQEAQATLENTLKGGSDISGVFVTTSKVFKIVDYLKKFNINAIVIGYDLIENNLSFLRNGDINFLLNQNPNQQSYLGISYLTDQLVFGKEVPRRKLLPIDIVTRENVEFYTNA